METLICKHCGPVEDYLVENAGPHLKATCLKCGNYIQFIKQSIKQKQNAMDKTINLRINIDKINPKFLYKGENGRYLDCTLFYKEVANVREINGKSVSDNGMIVQAVPKDVWEAEKELPKDKKTRGEILGNAKVFAKGGNAESIPGQGATASGNANAGNGLVLPGEEEGAAEDLPF